MNHWNVTKLAAKVIDMNCLVQPELAAAEPVTESVVDGFATPLLV